MNRKQLRALADRTLGTHVGCGDSTCVFGHAGGMATNGGCSCLKERPVQTALRLYMLLRGDRVTYVEKEAET